MKNLLYLSLFLMASGCATQTDPATTASNQASSAEAAPIAPVYERVKIGMSRQEAQSILGEPASVTETAEGSTCVWVYGQPVASTAPQNTANDGQTISQIGNIAATAAGIFIPYVGLAASLGTQVYSLSNSVSQNSNQPTTTVKDNTLVVTVEFRDDKVFSIQHAHPIAAKIKK